VEAKSSELSYPESAPERPLRVLLDGRKLGDGGIGVYTENLIEGLLESGGVSITVIYRDEAARRAPYADRIAWIYDRARPYSLDEMLFMSRRIDFSRFDVFHTPHYVLPFGITIPSVITVHDLIHISHPERFFYPAIARFLIGSSVRRADGVLTVSRHTRAGVLDLTGAAEEKVRLAPNAISSRILHGLQRGGSPATPNPYLFALFSNNKPHKGLADLVTAYRIFRESGAWRSVTPTCPELVLAGFGLTALSREGARNSVVGNVEGVRVIGALSDSELRSYLGAAHALVVPSLVEGFCLPALEAQASGTPVVCRPVPALKEIVTERDTVATDFSVAALKDAIVAGLEKSVGAPRGVSGSNLDLFSCKRVAMIVRSEYERVVGARSFR
jgi:glycosyltransferase involved in cell wall biosynthesis